MLAEDSGRREKELQIYIPPGPRLGNVVIEGQDLRKAYGDNILFDALSFSVPAGATVGIIGPNGAGKTTLFRLITGEEKADAGELRVGETVDLTCVDQLRGKLNPAKSVWELVCDGPDLINVGRQEVNSRSYLARYVFSGADQQKKVGALSGGERNRVHLALMLKEGANVILLDEPTSNLDVNTLLALEEGILSFEGDSSTFWFEGNFTEYEEDKRRRLGDAAVEPHRITCRHLTRG